MTTEKDNTQAAHRVMFPEGRFWPQVAYAPDEGGDGGSNDGGTNDQGNEAGSSEGGSEKVTPANPVREEAEGLYPGQVEGGTTDGNSDTQNPDGTPRQDSGSEETEAETGDEDEGKEGDTDEGADDADDDVSTEIDLNAVPDDKTDYSLTMPNGVDLDKPLLDRITPALRAKGFTHQEAQELADQFIEHQMDQQAETLEDWNKTVTGWEDTAKKDKDIGGDKWDATIMSAKAAIDTFGNAELKKALDNSGMGSHPEVIRMFAKVGNTIQDDDIPNDETRNTRPAQNSSAEQAAELYGGTTPLTRQ